MRNINVVAKIMARNGLKTANSLGCAFHFESDFNWLNRITLACKHGRLLLGNLHLYRNHQTVTKGLVQSEVFFNLLWAGTDKCRDNWPNHKPAIIVFFSCKISMLKACYFHIPLRTGDVKWSVLLTLLRSISPEIRWNLTKSKWRCEHEEVVFNTDLFHAYHFLNKNSISWGLYSASFHKSKSDS